MKKWRPRDSFPFPSDKGNLHFSFKTRPPWRSTRLVSLVEADRKGGRALGWASPRKVKSQAIVLTSGWERLHARHSKRRTDKPAFRACNLEVYAAIKQGLELYMTHTHTLSGLCHSSVSCNQRQPKILPVGARTKLCLPNSSLTLRCLDLMFSKHKLQNMNTALSKVFKSQSWRCPIFLWQIGVDGFFLDCFKPPSERTHLLGEPLCYSGQIKV